MQIIKYLIAVNGRGQALPTVVILVDDRLDKEEYRVEEVKGFSPYAGQPMPGYFVTCKTRVGNENMFMWYLGMLRAYINEHLRPDVALDE